jgi:hypothetical protein
MGFRGQEAIPMINHVTWMAERDSKSLQEIRSFRDSAPEAPKPEKDVDIPTLLTVSRDIRGSLLSMLATLKLLNRGYYGKMDEGVAKKIGELLCHATRVAGIAEACLERTSPGNEEVEITLPNRIEHLERSTPSKPVSMGTKGNRLIL